MDNSLVKKGGNYYTIFNIAHFILEILSALLGGGFCSLHSPNFSLAVNSLVYTAIASFSKQRLATEVLCRQLDLFKGDWLNKIGLNP